MNHGGDHTRAIRRYLYDPLGRRIAKRRLAPAGHITEQTPFTWDYRPGTFTPLTQTERHGLRDAPQDEIGERFYAIVTDLIGAPPNSSAQPGPWPAINSGPGNPP